MTEKYEIPDGHISLGKRTVFQQSSKGALAITVPAVLMKEYGWKKDQLVEVSINGDGDLSIHNTMKLKEKKIEAGD